MTGVASLEALFGTDDAPGWSPRVRQDDGAEIFSRTRASSVTCTSYACEVQEELGAARVKVMGFFCDDNPGTAVETVCDGHDFAVVDGRFVVDGWIKLVEQISDRVAFDLASPADADEVARLYGDRTKWERCG